MLFIDILLLFLYEVDFFESTSRVYETLTTLYKLSNLITLDVIMPMDENWNTIQSSSVCNL